MKQLFIIISISVQSILVFGQTNDATIKGNLKDEKKQPLEFANVLLIKATDSSLVKATVTNENGDFEITNFPIGEYRIECRQIGFSKYYSEKFSSTSAPAFDGIVLKENSKVLKEVEITNKRPFLEHQPGKTIVNVDNSIVSSGGTVMDVLEKSPGIMVDKDGNISLKGKSNVLVMIDGKPTYLSGEQLVNLLKTLPADQADQIELMTNPPAKYDASGNAGIINIKLKKNKYFGFNGTVMAGYSQGIYPRTSDGFNLNFRNEKVNVFANYNFSDKKSLETIDLTRLFHDNNGNLSNDFTQKSSLTRNSLSNYFKGGADFFISKNQTLGVVMNGLVNPSSENNLNNTKIKSGTEVLQSGVITNSTSDNTENNIAANLNYKWDIDSTGGSFTADADYALFNFTSAQHIRNDYFDSTQSYNGISSILRSSVPSSVEIRSVKSDFTKTIFQKIKLEAGIKSSLVTTDNDVKYYTTTNGIETIDSTKTNHFTYSENINAAYISLSKEFKKISIQGGLRDEQTIAKGTQLSNDSTFIRNYFHLFPTLFIGYKMNSKNQFDFSYSNRIDRPEYDILNPFKFYLDPYTYAVGNPFLKPEFTNSVELSHTFMDRFTTSINFSQTKDVLMQVPEQIDSTKTTFFTRQNFGTKNSYGLSFILPFSISKWWTTTNSINIVYFDFQGTFLGAQYNNAGTFFQGNSSNEFQLSKGWVGEVSGNYHSTLPFGIFIVKPEYEISLGIQKKILKNRGKLKLNVQNIIHSSQDVTIKYQNMDVAISQQRDIRFVALNFSYNFGKTSVKSSRQHSSGVEDEINRTKGKN